VLGDRTIDLLEKGVDVALRMGSLDDSAMTARRIAQSRRLVIGTPPISPNRTSPTRRPI